MSFYSYKNSHADSCPGRILADPARGLNERVCVQVKRVYDSCMQQEQLDDKKVTVTSLMALMDEPQCDACNEYVQQNMPSITPPICFDSCRSSSTAGIIRNLTIDRLCDRPCFARIKCQVEIPIDILFTDCTGQQGIGRSFITVDKDVLMSIPDESIVPFTLEAMCSAICVTGTYSGDNVFTITVCVTVILKILAEVELLIPSYGFCPIPPCEEYAENVCDEFFSLPIFPPNPNCSCSAPSQFGCL